MSKQKGLSLIELMIAMTLGLILMAGVVRIFLSSKQTYTVVTAQSQAQENARVVTHFLGRGLRHAGYWSDPTVARDFDDRLGFGEDEVITATNNDATNNSDTVTIRYNGAADGAIHTCLNGQPDETEIAVDRYFIAPASGSEQVAGLRCQSQIFAIGSSTAKSNTTQTLIVGVENLQIELGLGDEMRVKEYVSPDEVTDWTEVKSIRYAVLATSNQDTAGQKDTRSYQLIDGETVNGAGDKRLRLVQKDTVFLRNYRGK
ncbi:PilW family protein [Marinobacter sp. NFXS9]|uniref:PilW family protein n=1 Tax=Marinobacter sp. NFXS9 TaxID=2818433 RepID=UPI0032DF8C5F